MQNCFDELSILNEMWMIIYLEQSYTCGWVVWVIKIVGILLYPCVYHYHNNLILVGISLELNGLRHE